MTHAATPIAVAVTLSVTAVAAPADDLRDVPVYHSGTEFALRFVLTEPSYPALIHVDPRGRTAIVHPDPVSSPVPRVDAGAEIVWPDPESAVVWSLSGDPGYESFILVANRDPAIDLHTVEAEVAAISDAWRETGGVRAALVDELEAYLADALGPVRTTTILHLP